jgi:hypothetical protein
MLINDLDLDSYQAIYIFSGTVQFYNNKLLPGKLGASDLESLPSDGQNRCDASLLIAGINQNIKLITSMGNKPIPGAGKSVNYSQVYANYLIQKGFNKNNIVLSTQCLDLNTEVIALHKTASQLGLTKVLALTTQLQAERLGYIIDLLDYYPKYSYNLVEGSKTWRSFRAFGFTELQYNHKFIDAYFLHSFRCLKERGFKLDILDCETVLETFNPQLSQKIESYLDSKKAQKRKDGETKLIEQILTGKYNLSSLDQKSNKLITR